MFVCDNEETPVTRYSDLALKDTTEIIIYKDEITCQNWRKLGYDPSLRGTMFYLISDSGELTFVVEDELASDAQLVLNAILERLPALSRLAELEEAA